MAFTLTLVDIIIIITIFQLTIFISFLIFFKRERLSNLLLASFLFSQLIMMLTALSNQLYDYFYAHFPHFFYLSLPFFSLASPVLYCYVRSLADADFTLAKKHLGHFLPFICLFLYFAVTFYIYPASTKRLLLDNGNVVSIKYISIYRVMYYCQILTYNIASLKVIADYRIKIKQQFSSIDHINLTWLKMVIFGFICAWLTDVFSFASARLHLDIPIDLKLVDFAAFFIFFNIIFFRGLTHPQIFSLDRKARYQSSTLTKTAAEEYLQKLNVLMQKLKPHLNSSVTLKALAEQIDIPPRYLSQIINEYLNQNFYDFITKHRIKEAENQLSLSSESRKTVLEIMYKVGFNSKSAFNQSFKKYTGMTPSQYKKNLSH